MTERARFSRRQFTVSSALLVLAAVPMSLTSCGDSSGGSTPTAPPAPTPTPSSDVSGSVSANHGHTATITAAELSAGGNLSLDIQGDSNHPHTVDLTPAELSQIAAGTRVSKTSTVDQSHDHVVTFN